VRISISEQRLADADNQFEALSYTWAPLRPWKEVLCGRDRTLPATASLYDALTVLLLPDRPRVFWIDQLAINQRDVAEKSA
jgi:hypothetical protein